jgi:hypothetical protein
MISLITRDRALDILGWEKVTFGNFSELARASGVRSRIRHLGLLLAILCSIFFVIFLLQVLVYLLF